MEINEVTIVVPVYDMGPLRFNNFCYLIKKLNDVGCSVIVTEQISERSGPVEQMFVSLSNVKHIVTEIDSDEFNK